MKANNNACLIVPVNDKEVPRCQEPNNEYICLIHERSVSFGISIRNTATMQAMGPL